MNDLNKFDETLMTLNKKSTNKTKIREAQSVYSNNEEEIDLLLSAKNIFLDEYCRNAIESYIEKKNSDKNSDKSQHTFNIKEIRNEARSLWNSMTDEERAVYEEKVNFNKDFYTQMSNSDPKRVNAYNLFTRDKMASARSNNKTKTIVECAREWNKFEKELKEIYGEYSDLIREERKLQQDGLTLADKTFNKVNLPYGPFKYYVKSLLKNEENIDDVDELLIDGIFIKNAAEQWNDLSEDEREKFILKYNKERHEFVVKRMEFVLQLRHKNKKPRTAFNLFTNDIQSKYTNKFYRQGEFFDFLFEKWCDLDKDSRLDYEIRAEDEREEFAERASEEREARHEAKREKMILKNLPEEEEDVIGYLSTEWTSKSEKEKENYFDNKERKNLLNNVERKIKQKKPIILSKNKDENVNDWDNFEKPSEDKKRKNNKSNNKLYINAL